MGSASARAHIFWLSLALISSTILFSSPLQAQVSTTAQAQVCALPSQPKSEESATKPAETAPAPKSDETAPAPKPSETAASKPGETALAPKRAEWISPKAIDAAAATTSLPSGGIGQILVKTPHTSTIRIFEVDSSQLGKWTWSSEIVATTIKQITDNTYERRGFLPADSSIIRFLVPEKGYNFWDMRNFVVRVCDDKTVGAWAIVRAPVTSPNIARAISAVIVILLYLGFAYAIYKSQAIDHPLAPKYPEYKTRRFRGWTEYLNPVVLTAGTFNQGSIQKLQVLFFSLLVAGMVLSLVLTLGVLSDLSSTVAILLGISAVGAAVGTKTNTANERIKFENWAWLVRRKVLPITRQEDPKWSDLVTTRREFDVYKLQTLIFSIVVAVALLTASEYGLVNFTVPETLLGILGLSQVVYVAGELVRPPSFAELDKSLSELRVLEGTVRTAIDSKTDTDDAGRLLPAPSTPPVEPGKNATRQYQAKANQVEIMLESTLEIEVDPKKLTPFWPIETPEPSAAMG